MMRKKLKQILSDSLYRRTLLFYSLSMVLFTALILISLFGVVSHSIRETASENSRVLLNSLVTTSHYIKTDVDSLMSSVVNDSSTVAFVKSKEERKLTNYYLHQLLLEYKSVYSYVVDLSVVNLDNSVSVQASGTNVNGDVNLQFAQDALESGAAFLPRRIYLFNPYREYDVVSFLYWLPYDRSAVIVDVDVSRFRLGIPADGSASRDAAILSGDSGWVVYPERYAKSDLSRDYLQNILAENGGTQDQFEFNDTSRGIILFFSRSQEMDWWFIDAQSYSQFSRTYLTISFWFLGVTLAILAVCCILPMCFGWSIRKPLIKLVEKCRTNFETDVEPGDEIQYLDQVIARVEHERWLSDKYVTSLYLRSMLLGQEMPFFFSRERQELLRDKYAAPLYRVLLLRVEPDYEVEEEKRAEEMNMLRYTVCNLAEEIFGEEYRCETVDLGSDLTAVLLLEPSRGGEEYLSCFRQLRDFAARHIQVQLRGSMGPEVDGFDDIQYSCLKARQYLDMDGLVSAGSLVDANTVAENSYQEKNRKLVESVEKYTKANYSDSGLSLKSISQQFGLSTTYLGKIFKSVKGVSYSSFVTLYRLEQAKLALVETSKTVNEISEEVGFSNSTYFATVFKSTYGITPTVYRNQARK